MTRNILTTLLWLLLASCLVSPATAQTASQQGDTASELAPLIEKAKKEGMSVIVISPPDASKDAQAAAPVMSMTEQGLMIRGQIRRVLVNIPNIPEQFLTTIRAASPDGTLIWLAYAIAIAAGGIILGNAVSWVYRKLIQSYAQKILISEPKNRTEKIGFLLFRAALITVNCILMFVFSMLLAVALDYGHEPTRSTIIVIVTAYVSYWVIRAVILFNIIAHDLPKHRMINLDDETAKNLQYAIRNSMVVVIIALAVCAWMDLLGINREAHKLFLILAMLIAALVFGRLTVKYREALRSVILGHGVPETRPLWRRFIAGIAPAALIGYLVLSWLVTAYRLVMDLPAADILVAAPGIAFFGALPIYGILLILIDKFYQIRQRRFDIKVRQARHAALQAMEIERKAREDALASGPATEVLENIVSHSGHHDSYPVFKPLFKPVIEQAASILVFVGALGFVLNVWDIRAGDRGNPITAFMDTLLILFVAWLLYRAVVIFVDNRLVEEGAGVAGQAADLEDEPGGHGSSRLGTLLPLLRNIFIGTIAVIAGMIVLSNLGVDIAPLFAGAGVLGLAVGFGAQTLIRDIFSGGFFLFDDAFRKGEYIELGNVRGTVEKISLRSFQLRHHNGPLHTIPFGEIKQLTNYSRDWVIMKLPLRVTYDTDVEKVRKLVKKLGQQLLEHPDVGKNFLQPLKSQGVVQMEDSAMIIRVKFMTMPGDQWVTRKVVYQAIQDLFRREGIQFANKEVTVRIAGEDNGEMTPRKREAIAGAARRVLDDATAGPVAAMPDD
ncbi:MAG: mechanosensitive ion channel domain-containing protein [Rhizobiaceae bacterium]